MFDFQWVAPQPLESRSFSDVGRPWSSVPPPELRCAFCSFTRLPLPWWGGRTSEEKKYWLFNQMCVEKWKEMESLKFINKLKLNRRSTCKTREEPDEVLVRQPCPVLRTFPSTVQSVKRLWDQRQEWGQGGRTLVNVSHAHPEFCEWWDSKPWPTLCIHDD